MIIISYSSAGVPIMQNFPIPYENVAKTLYSKMTDVLGSVWHFIGDLFATPSGTRLADMSPNNGE